VEISISKGRTAMKENNTTKRGERKENNTAKGRSTPQNENNLTNGGKTVKFDASNEKQTLFLILLLLLLTILMTMIGVQVFKATVVRIMVGRFKESPPPPTLW